MPEQRGEASNEELSSTATGFSSGRMNMFAETMGCAESDRTAFLNGRFFCESDFTVIQMSAGYAGQTT